MSIYEASMDDTDPQIIYSDGWVPVTTDGDWKGTMHSTSNIGASARVRFTGTRIAFICTIPTGSGQRSLASFSIDNGSPVTVAHATTPPVQWQTTFWDSGPLAYGSHLVVMTNVGNEAYLRLDRVDYDPTAGNAPVVVGGTGGSGSTAGAGGDKTTTIKATLTSTVVVGPSVTGDTQPLSSSSLSSSSVSASATLIGSANQSLTSQLTSDSSRSQTGGTPISPTGSIPNPSSSAIANLPDTDSASAINTAGSAEKASNTPVAAIVGGVLGGLLAIALVMLSLLYCRRRRRARRAAYLNDPGANSRPSMSHSRAGVMSTVPTPFGLNRRSHERNSNSNLMVHAHASSAFLPSASLASSPTSTYYPESSTSGFYAVGQPQHPHSNGGLTSAFNGNNPGGAVGSKHGEFMAEQQQQQQQQTRLAVDFSAVAGEQMRNYDGIAAAGQPVQSLGGGSSSVGGFQDHDAPPAYPGTIQDVEASPGWKA